MDPSDEVCKSLIKWLQTLVPNNTRNVNEISDGVAMLRALVQISPECFKRLEPKIKCDVGTNWRLKISNLKKIVEAVTEYYQDELNSQILEIGKPDVVKIGENNDAVQLGKLLRLILGCAVNCARKQDYITQIMSMEESVQRSIMQAIQQLEELLEGPGRSGLSMLSIENDTRILRLVNELEAANEAKDTLAQHCHNLELQVQTLQEEKQVLLTDNQYLSKQLQEQETSAERSKSPDTRRQMILLKEELFRVETMRDDYRAKIVEQEKQIAALEEKINDLQVAVNATSRLKDEVDALSESADKVQVLENTVASYKKRLEDYADIKKQLKHLEEKNAEYLQQNIKYEEELKMNVIWKTQAEMYKKEVLQLQHKLDEETQKADKASFQNKSLELKLISSQGEKERLAQERAALREEIEELKLGKLKWESGAAMSQELVPSEIKERFKVLEKENSELKMYRQEVYSRQALLDDVVKRLEKMQEAKRNANKRILELEAQLEERKAQSEDQWLTQIREYKQKIVTLQDNLAVKENELQLNQAKYNRSLEKAREVAQNLEQTKSNNSTDSLKHRNMKEFEDRLITTAFYRLSLACQRDAVDERLALLSAGQGQSFLSRQRQPTARKPVQSLKSK